MYQHYFGTFWKVFKAKSVNARIRECQLYVECCIGINASELLETSKHLVFDNFEHLKSPELYSNK